MTQFQLNSGLICYVLVARHFHEDITPESIAHKYSIVENDLDPSMLVRIAREGGFKCKMASLNWSKLFRVGEAFPIIARFNDGRYVILSGVRGEAQAGDVALIDPSSGNYQFQFYTREQLEAVWSGQALMIKKTFAVTDERQPFGLGWFVPEMFKHKQIFRDIALATMTCNVLSLGFPIYMQLVLDRVLQHQSISTLTVLSIGLLGVFMLDGVLSYLKRYMLLFATNKMDLNLARVIYGHVLRLPIDFFDNTPAGILLKHIGEKDKIRQFMTGRLFLTILDATILIVLIPLLFFYSTTLTCIVLGMSVVVAIITGFAMGSFRKRLRHHYEAEARRHSHLVESIRGIHTVKSLALEPHQYRAWENLSSRAVSTAFHVEKLSAVVSTGSTFIQNITSLLVVWVGASMAFDNQLTMGAIVAFQILSSKVTQPLVSIVSILHEYQEIGLSVSMLGEIMNRPEERPLSARGLVGPISGSIGIERVTFRYSPGSPPALMDLSLNFPAGSIVGIVGRSGSGKSTLTRLIQGLYPLQEGRVTVDGLDLRDIDLAHLRRSIGVVLQENFLFHGTVRENISATKPSATFEEVVMAARLAGADEFIQRLPQGYDSPIVEGGANLSGGQRQRLAIARALIMEPPILILDEATSALDAESESIIQANLAGIAKGRTLIIVSHRLSMLASAHSIVVLDRGLLVGNAPHHDLLRTCPIYADLWHKQNRHMEPGALTGGGWQAQG